MIHPTASISSLATIGDNCQIGAYSVIDEHVHIEDNVTIESNVRIYPFTTIGKGTHVFDGAILGSIPQDLKFQGEQTFLEIGENCTIREYCTVNRGTASNLKTILGNYVLLMAYVHVAHDCVLEDNVVLANGVQLGGHVLIDKSAVVGGMTAIQQFNRIGPGAFVGGTLKVDRDVPPFVKALGNPIRYGGLNHKGTMSHQLSDDEMAQLEKIYKLLYSKSVLLKDALLEIQKIQSPLSESILEFIQDKNQNKLLPR